MIVNTLPIRETPAYRVDNNPRACNLVELLAAIIGGQEQIEIAQEIVKRFENIDRLIQANSFELQQVQGIGESTAIRLKAAMTLSKRLLEPRGATPGLHHPDDSFNAVSPVLSHREQEHFVVVVLNTRNAVIDIVEVVRGTVNSAPIRLAEVFRPAIRLNAAGIVCAHNHPSGDPSPSPDDVALTREIVKFGSGLGIQVLDHLILGQGKRYVSLKERNLGFD